MRDKGTGSHEINFNGSIKLLKKKSLANHFSVIANLLKIVEDEIVGCQQFSPLIKLSI